jgi:hypothetical protein
MGKSVAGGACLDDLAVEGEPVDDGGAKSGVGEGLGPAGERLVGGDRDGGLFLPFGEDLEQQLSAAAVEFEVAELVADEEIDPAVASDRLRQLFLVGGLDELVDQLGCEDVADRVPGLRGGGP